MHHHRRLPQTFAFLVLTLGCRRSSEDSKHQSVTVALPAASAVPDSGWTPARILDRRATDSTPEEQFDVIQFRNGRRLVVPLFGVEYVGLLPRRSKAPLLVLSGMGCHECDDTRNIYVAAADAESVSVELKHYAYPGSITSGDAEDSDSTPPSFRARFFIGECLRKGEPVGVWFQASRDSSGHWRDAVYRLALEGDSAIGRFAVRRPPLDSTIALVHAGRCKEVVGIDQIEL